ncbi:MAG: dienelactone hydrolase family protein [Deltaproteobacteria bacterium]|nr:dienelactone hydrolase family protein [Kofleriaceae bacterium]
MHETFSIPTGDTTIEGDLATVDRSHGTVVFAHGSGSGRFSPRNRHVARTLQSRGLSTLLVDLLTLEEERSERLTRHLRFDVDLLARRLVGVTRWLTTLPAHAPLPIGYFGASTGAAAALIAAAHDPTRIAAIVSRGGRPDLAATSLAEVKAPTLLVVGGSDSDVLILNRRAQMAMRAECQLEVVPGATHLFEEPGALDRVARLASEWFLRCFDAAQPPMRSVS